MKSRTRRGGTAFGIRERGKLPVIDCPVCGRTMETARLYEVHGRAGEIVAKLRGVPCHICPDDAHPRVPSSNDFRTKLAEAVLRADFPATHPRRFRKMGCSGCRKRMRESPPVEGEIEGSFRVDGAEMTLYLLAPLVECGRCGMRQLHATPEVSSRVRAALDAALERGRLGP